MNSISVWILTKKKPTISNATRTNPNISIHSRGDEKVGALFLQPTRSQPPFCSTIARVSPYKKTHQTATATTRRVEVQKHFFWCVLCLVFQEILWVFNLLIILVFGIDVSTRGLHVLASTYITLSTSQLNYRYIKKVITWIDVAIRYFNSRTHKPPRRQKRFSIWYIQ